ncbi:MAG TPA: porin family protein [Chitinophagaceae bacterium]
MKKWLILCLLAGYCNILSAQVLIAVLFGNKLNTGKIEFGITVNPVFSGITNLESEYKTGLNLGIYFNFRPDKKFYFHVEGIAKGSFGAKDIAPYTTNDDTLDALFAGGSIVRKIKVFSMPVLGRYALSKKFYLEAGIQPDLILKVHDIFKTKANDNELEYKIKVTDQYNRIDIGVTGGIFFKFRPDRKSMGMGIRYMQGLTDIYKPMDGIQANKSWQIVITIPVGAAPKNETSSTKAN